MTPSQQWISPLGMEAAPDFIEPLEAVRIFQMRRGILYPMSYSARDLCWHGGLNHAICMPNCTFQSYLGRQCERIPPMTPAAWFRDHSCGFYACRDLDTLVGMFSFAAGINCYPYLRMVLGTVKLSGMIMQGDLGYRATRAEIATIVIPQSLGGADSLHKDFYSNAAVETYPERHVMEGLTSPRARKFMRALLEQ